MKKSFFENRKKDSFQVLVNGLKLVEILYLGVATIFQPATPQNVVMTDEAGGNSHISVTTGRRVMLYIAQNLRKYHVSTCTKKKLFYIFNTEKVTAEKQKLQPFLEISLTSNCVRSTVV